jgi:hypothetical protein
MRSFVHALVFILTVVTATSPLGAAVVVTGGSGNWNSTTPNAPWPGGIVPAAGSDIVIAAGHAVTGNVAISAASMTVAAGGKLSVGGVDITVSGGTSVSGTLEHTSTAGVKTFSGDVAIHAGGAWSETANRAMTFGGSFRNDGTLTANAGVHTFTGTAKTFGGANALAIPSVTVNGTYQNNGVLTVATALAGSGTLTQGPGSLLNIGGTSATFVLAASGTVNTVAYTGGAQTVKPTTYSNLILAGTGAKTIVTATVIVNGTLSMEGSCTASLVPTYGPAAALQYNTATARAAGPEWKTPFTAAGGVVITNTGAITLNADKALGDFVPPPSEAAPGWTAGTANWCWEVISATTEPLFLGRERSSGRPPGRKPSPPAFTSTRP